MKKIPLSSRAVRISCVVGDLLLGCFILLWLLLGFSWMAVLVAVCALFLICLYNIQVFRSTMLVRPEEKTITLTGLQARTDDVSAAAVVLTREVSVNGQTTRVILVEDGNGTELSSISTLNTLNHGYACEVTARELAEVLGVEFRPTVSTHLYDKKARKEYQARQKEAERQSRRDRRGKGKKGAVPQEPAEREEEGSINYDEMDDE